MIRLLSLVFGLLVGLVGLAGTAAADQPFKEDTFASSFNSCNGDSVDLAGKFQVQQNIKSGLTTFHVTFHGQGVGQPSGARYVLNFYDHVTFAPGDTEEHFKANLVSKGGEPNQVDVIVFKDGNLTFTLECRG